MFEMKTCVGASNISDCLANMMSFAAKDACRSCVVQQIHSLQSSVHVFAITVRFYFQIYSQSQIKYWIALSRRVESETRDNKKKSLMLAEDCIFPHSF